MKLKMVFATLLILLLLAVSSPACAQGNDEGLLKRETAFSPSPQFGMQFGTAFTTGGYGGSMFTNTISPHLGLDVSKNFHLEVGTIVSSSQIRGGGTIAPFGLANNHGQMQNLQGQRMFSTTIYAYGSYKVNSRLSLTGGTWVERRDMDEYGQQMNPMAFDTNPRGMMFGFDYKVNDNMRFGAEINMSSGVNPFNPLDQHHVYPHRNPGSMPFYRRN
ncbi:MAG: hypothetical protein ACLFN2_07045 [Bacteroidales bacterium]